MSKPSKEPSNNYGAYISNVSIIAEAAKPSEAAAQALAELARASAEHAKAISAIASALKGAGGEVAQGVAVSHVNTPNEA